MILELEGLSKSFGRRAACRSVSFELWPGEVLGIVGESGSGKTTLLRCIAGHIPPDAGRVLYTLLDGEVVDLATVTEARRRRLLRTEIGFVHQNPRDGLRLDLSAGANVGERLMAQGARHYGEIRAAALDWLGRVEIEAARISP
jgi:putative phosphonate transport system ATP-binding protein